MNRRDFLKLGLCAIGAATIEVTSSCAELGVPSIWMPPAVGPYWNSFCRSASKYPNISPHLTASLAIFESGLCKNSYNGTALGLMQITIPTAIQTANFLQIPNFKPEKDLFKPEMNIDIGTCYLSQMIDAWGSTSLGVCNYYGTCVDEGVGYKNAIIGMYEERNLSRSPSFLKWFLEHNGGDLSVAFAEQGLDYSAWYSQFILSDSPKSIAPTCQTYSSNNLPGDIYPGNTVGNITVQSGDTASGLWLQQGSPSEIKICK